MKELAESFHVVVERTGGIALLAVNPVILLFLLYAGLQAVGRSYWSKGTERRNKRAAREILDAPRDPGGEFSRGIAETAPQN